MKAAVEREISCDNVAYQFCHPKEQRHFSSAALIRPHQLVIGLMRSVVKLDSNWAYTMVRTSVYSDEGVQLTL